MKIIGAYHVAVFPGWEAIVVSQSARLRDSGLLAKTSEVLVGIAGQVEPARGTIDRLLDGKARVRAVGPLSTYEFGTLQLLHDACAIDESHCWYIHTKGVSSQSQDAVRHRRQLESVVIDKHAVCDEMLQAYDVCGPHWRLTGFDQPNPHFSGNFWWARSSYLRALPPPKELEVLDRYQAEFWIGKSQRVRPFEVPLPTDPFAKPSAWIGLEEHYRDLCEITPSSTIRCIVDIGVDYGYTTFQFARDFPGSQIVGVSDFKLHDDSEPWVREHLPLFPNLRIIKGDSPTCGLTFGQPVDLLHIDGDHSYEGVARDFHAWSQWVVDGGRVIFHDTESHSTVRRFFDELPGKKKEIKAHHGLGCWFKNA